MSRLLCFKSLKFLDLLKSSKYFSVVILLSGLTLLTPKIGFSQDSRAPTVTLTNSDSDNLIAASNTVTITATFSEALTTTPPISISGGLLSNVVMGGGSSGSVSFTATNISTSANGCIRCICGRSGR